MRKKTFIAAALFFGSFLHAQDSTKSLNEVVVTANKFPQKQNTTGKVVTIINQEILSRSIGKTLPELLNQQAGLTIIGAQNNLGTNQDVYMRGASTGKTLILIDGMPAYDPSTIVGAFDLNHFNIDNIERIEIVKGAMSTLYGSDAMAGVINIITKKGKGEPIAAYATLSGGSFKTFRGVAGVKGHFKKNNYNVQYGHLRSDGFSSAYDSTGTKGFDKDEFEQNTISAGFNSELTSNLLLKLKGELGKYRTDLDNGAFSDEKDYTFSSKNYQAGLGLEYKYSKGALVFNYNYNNTERNFLDDSTFKGGFAKFTKQQYTGRAQFAEVFSNIALSKNITLLAGTDYRYQNTDQEFFSISSFGPYSTKRSKDTTNVDQFSLYASAFLKGMGGFYLEFGGRYNNHSQYGDNATYSINPSYLIGENVKLFANFASAFKAPTLYQLYVTNQADKFPAQSLKPETSKTFDGGIEYTSTDKKWHSRAVYFNRSTKNGIDYSFVSYQYFNYNKQEDNGFELEADGKIGKISLTANYTYITGEVNTLKYRYDAPNFSYIATGDTTYNNLFRRPKNSVNLTVGYAPLEKLYISAHARFAGKRYEPSFMAASYEMEAYKTVDVYGEYKFSDKLKAFIDLKNIFDEQYFDVRGYNSRRFNFMTGINLNF